MKRLISVLLCTALVFGLLSIFPVKTYAFSGGSGTEDDPYLISTVQDLYELRNNIKAEPRSWLKKQHYKLTADIIFNGSISPLNKKSGYGFHCFEKTTYTLQSSVFNASVDDLEKWYDDYKEQYGYLYSSSWTDGWWGGPECFGYDCLSTASSIIATRSIYPSEDVGYGKVYYKELYRKIPFVGIFDGNGHTITTSGYLFGFVEDGAVVKNLTVKGDKAGIAYSIDKSSTVSGCILDSNWITTDYIETGYDIGEPGDLTDYEITSGIVAQNYGTIENCVNYADGISGIVGQNSGTVKNCMNFGTVCSVYDEACNGNIGNMVKKLMTDGWEELDSYCGSLRYPSAFGIKDGISCVDLGNSSYSKADDTLYTFDECIEAGGDKSAFSGLDFIYTWVMIEGMPYLRFACEGTAGDINFDGQINAKDANQLKTVLTLGIEGHDYRMIASFDVNVDEAINAKDSYILKQKLSGAN